MGFEENTGFIGFPSQQNEIRKLAGNDVPLGSYNTE